MKDLVGISPFFMAKHVPSSLAFYRDRLGFEITFRGLTLMTFISVLSKEVVLRYCSRTSV